MRPRRTARVLLFDEAERVLLIRCAVVRRGGERFEFWLTPGGEIEDGETPLDAARRELREELGIAPAIEGPAYVERNRFEHNGEMRDNTDFVFVAACAAEVPTLCGVNEDERGMMQELRWWSGAEVKAALGGGSDIRPREIFPKDLAARMEEFAGGRLREGGLGEGRLRGD